MGVSLEWVVGVIRAGEHHNKLEDDFELAGQIIKHNDHAILKGFAGKIPNNIRRDMRKLLIDLGIKTVEWQTDVENTVKGGGKIEDH